jgi:thymidylate kinase
MSSEPGGDLLGSHAVIELIGTPGAGKTTIALELIEILRARGVDAGTIVDAARPNAARTIPGRAVAVLSPERLRSPLLWQVFAGYGLLGAVGFALEHPTLSRRVFRSERARPLPRTMKRHTLYWFFQLGGRRRFLGRVRHGARALVVDDGFLHRSIALHASPGEEPDPRRIAGYVDLIPRPDLVINVRTASDVCERRIRARGLWRHRQGMSDDDLARYLRHAERVAAIAVARARERGWLVVDVENDEEGADAVRPALESAVDLLVTPSAPDRARRELDRS